MSKFGLSAEDVPVAFNGQARFLVFGVGGGGGNAVEHMMHQGINGVGYVCANTDAQALGGLSVPHKLQIGPGKGAGGDPEKGRHLAEEDEAQIREFLQGYDLVFITAGMGGGTGTGAAPVVARIAKEMDIMTVAVVTMPFDFEGKKRLKAAKDGVDQLAQYVDAIITVPNQKLLQVYRKMTMRDAFKKADDVLLHAVNGLARIVVEESYINIDFEDIRTAMTTKGHAMMGVGHASGEDRARIATESAIRSPLLDDIRLENAKGLIVSVAASELMLGESEEISEIVNGIIDLDDANMFYGFVEDESMGDEIHVTVIATGLELDTRPKVAPTSLKAVPEHVSALQQQVHATQVAATAQTATQIQEPSTTVSQGSPKRSPFGGRSGSLDVASYLKSQQNHTDQK